MKDRRHRLPAVSFVIRRVTMVVVVVSAGEEVDNEYNREYLRAEKPVDDCQEGKKITMVIRDGLNGCPDQKLYVNVCEREDEYRVASSPDQACCTGLMVQVLEGLKKLKHPARLPDLLKTRAPSPGTV